ncbi:thiol reductant ABC exporter subunit CydD [Actinoallomurus rhizosphaericola]|uniref:thiol reductant ABC exporter subunit CydD n=1 Tax=Actinoallomurus rhizosphaericola TaxID=2952536 RepID=UPI002092D9D0|nr:thiol reductant ABC exporter subunit CydD [Actinoallomurus rhizosphaericola]MCO5999750.1 thiol reductant ABC exporter subunit CydD [Actinoallomurus rhizosphaericola]
MRPFDPRLPRYATAARAHLALAVVLGLVTTGLVLAQAGLLANVLAGHGAVAAPLAALLAVVGGRALAAYGGEASALRAAALVRSQLRRRLIARAVERPGRAAGEVATLATRGLDALDAYFARYLPQLVLACLTPLAVLAVAAGVDPLSALVIAVTLPLIPIFMILVGLQTRARTERQWLLLERLGGHFLDVVEGLPTLKVFNRAKAQVRIIRDITAAHRRATMRTLRVAFLSALVLELLSTLALALVAVEVGLRLLSGGLPYEKALFVLLLAPEAYLPLRNVGAQYHAGMEGVTAAGRALDLIETPEPPRGLAGAPVSGGAASGGAVTGEPASGGAVIRLDGVTVRHPDRDAPALDDVSLTVEPGERLIVTGPSGAGKSTLLAVLLGFVRPETGSTSFEGIPEDEWLRRIAWVPQHPHLFAGTIADNIRLGDVDAPLDAVRAAARLAGAAGFVDALSDGYGTDVGERGLRLSSGQRQRIALARAFLRDAPILLLDEPTAHLDVDSAGVVRDAVERLMAGRTVVLVTHDPAWSAAADRVVDLSAGRLREEMEPA